MKYIIEAGYDFDGSDVEADIIKETLQESLNCHVDIEEYHEPDVPKALVYEPPEHIGTLWQAPDTEYQNPDKLLKQNLMLYVEDSQQPFRCDCGSNVFSLYQEPDGRQYYECHGCWTAYRGEKS